MIHGMDLNVPMIYVACELWEAQIMFRLPDAEPGALKFSGGSKFRVVGVVRAGEVPIVSPDVSS